MIADTAQLSANVKAPIASNAPIMAGVRIGVDGMVGSGAIVLTDVPDYGVVAGVPAGPIRTMPAANSSAAVGERPAVLREARDFVRPHRQSEQLETAAAVPGGSSAYWNSHPAPCAVALSNATWTGASHDSARRSQSPARGTQEIEFVAAVSEVIDTGQFVLGEPVVAFERDFARYSDATENIAINTGTSALHLALLAAGVGPGDEVITVPLTSVATVAAIRYTGRHAGVRRHRSAHLHDGSDAIRGGDHGPLS